MYGIFCCNILVLHCDTRENLRVKQQWRFKINCRFGDNFRLLTSILYGGWTTLTLPTRVQQSGRNNNAIFSLFYLLLSSFHGSLHNVILDNAKKELQQNADCLTFVYFLYFKIIKINCRLKLNCLFCAARFDCLAKNEWQHEILFGCQKNVATFYSD